jgi:hypothetical protein
LRITNLALEYLSRAVQGAKWFGAFTEINRATFEKAFAAGGTNLAVGSLFNPMLTFS